MTTPEQSDSWVWLARILRPQGRKGEVFAGILTDFPEKFADRKRLWLLTGHFAAKIERSSAAQNPHSGSHHDTTLTVPQVSGHDFSRAENAVKSTGALAPGGNTLTGPAPHEVELIAHWLHKGGVVLHFAGVDSISSAETLKGLIVAIPQAERAALAEDEVFIGELIGCLLVDVASAEPVTVGEIEDVDRTAGPAALLVVRGAAGEVLIPFAKSYLRSIDLAGKRVEMALPEGLVDLNAPGKTT